jgi:hypothetical protein
MRATLAAALWAGVAGCTFPTVDYVDDGGPEAGAACKAPMNCANTAQSCAGIADNKHKSCTHQCKVGDTACIAQCDATFMGDLAKCVDTCCTCTSMSCDSGPTNCGALVGL